MRPIHMLQLNQNNSDKRSTFCDIAKTKLEKHAQLSLEKEQN